MFNGVVKKSSSKFYQFYCLSFLRNMELDSVNTCFPENIDHEYYLKNGRLCLTAELDRKVKGILFFANRHGIPALNRFYISHSCLPILPEGHFLGKQVHAELRVCVSVVVKKIGWIDLVIIKVFLIQLCFV